MNRLWNIILVVAGPLLERLAGLLQRLPWLHGDTDIPPYTRPAGRPPAAPRPPVEEPPVMRGGEGWPVEPDDGRPSPPASLPGMQPDYAAPPSPPAGAAWDVEDEAGEEAEPVGSAPPTAPQPEPVPAGIGPEPAGKPLFSAYYPREVRPDHWQPLRAYIFKDSAAQAVILDARAQFGARADIRATSREALQPVLEDALVTALPSVPGFEFDPPQASLRFREDWRRFEFEFRARTAPLDASADGRITFLVEGMIVADVPISVYVSETAGAAPLGPQEATAEPYQAIFCSYSHKDTAIVERVERASRFFNFRYLRDVTTLRSGEAWNQRLLELIDDADIFQLFWSKHAAESDYVRQEYQYAEALRRNGVKRATFIRPIRWEEPMPAPPPPELSALHFDLILELAGEGS